MPPSTAYAKLDAVADKLLAGICKMLDSGKVKKAIEDGSLELLGGGFYDPMCSCPGNGPAGRLGADYPCFGLVFCRRQGLLYAGGTCIAEVVPGHC